MQAAVAALSWACFLLLFYQRMKDTERDDHCPLPAIRGDIQPGNRGHLHTEDLSKQGAEPR